MDWEEWKERQRDILRDMEIIKENLCNSMDCLKESINADSIDDKRLAYQQAVMYFPNNVSEVDFTLFQEEEKPANCSDENNEDEEED